MASRRQILRSRVSVSALEREAQLEEVPKTQPRIDALQCNPFKSSMSKKVEETPSQPSLHSKGTPTTPSATDIRETPRRQLRQRLVNIPLCENRQVSTEKSPKTSPSVCAAQKTPQTGHWKKLIVSCEKFHQGGMADSRSEDERDADIKCNEIGENSAIQRAEAPVAELGRVKEVQMPVRRKSLRIASQRTPPEQQPSAVSIENRSFRDDGNKPAEPVDTSCEPGGVEPSERRTPRLDRRDEEEIETRKIKQENVEMDREEDRVSGQSPHITAISAVLEQGSVSAEGTCGSQTQSDSNSDVSVETEDEDGEDSTHEEGTNEPLPSAPTYAAPSGPYDISQSKAESPVQPRLKTFPRTLHEDRMRSFSDTWYQCYPWLEYSVSQNSSFCYACRHYSLPNAPGSAFTSTSGFCHWKKALYKDGGFKRHAKSKEHTGAMFAWKDHERLVETNSSMLRAINKGRRKKIEANRKYIKTVADVLLLTATQNIAQRGCRKSEGSLNRGNFLAILQEIAKHDPQIQKCMSASGNAKYTSKVIQNEILDCLAEMVRSDIIKEVKESQVFSVLADETKDLSKKEQLSFVLRYYYDGAVHESFLDFQQADKLDAAGLSNMIISSLEGCGLEFRSHLVGQGYDGAAVLSGKHSGVSARIKEEAKYAFYVHCRAHCLNLVLVDAVKSVPEADSFFAMLQQLYVFMSSSYVHPKWVEVQKEMYEGQPRELQRLSDTRWACTQSACRNLMDRLPAVIRVLQDITHESSGDMAVDARGLLAQIDLTFIGLLVVFRKILTDTKFLSDMLQSPSVDLARAVDLVDVLLDTLQHYRDEDAFKQLWAEVQSTCQKCNVGVPMSQKRQQKTRSPLHGSLITCTLGGRRNEPVDIDSFRQSIFYPILDNMVSELQRRFSKINCKIMKGIQALHPNSTTFLDEKSLFVFAEAYDSNLEDLKYEVHQVKRLLERKEKNGVMKPSTPVKFVVFLEPFKDAFHELFRLLKIAVVTPVSSASCERSFSALKLIKSHLRTTMDNDRLSNLGILSIEARRARALDLDEFVKRFASRHANRLIMLF